MSDADKTAAVWLQNDAGYLYRWARQYRDNGDVWMAVKAQEGAAWSSKIARIRMGIEAAEGAS